MKIIILLSLLISVTTIAETKNVKTENGRFQLIQLGGRDDQYLLDTQTGNLWQPQCILNGKNGVCELRAFNKVYVIGINATLDKLIETYNKHKKDSP